MICVVWLLFCLVCKPTAREYEEMVRKITPSRIKIGLILLTVMWILEADMEREKYNGFCHFSLRKDN